jgi:hypothetical protein
MKAQAISVALALYATVCVGQSNVVHYGANSNELAVAFTDANLSAKAKSAIVADLRICLSSRWGKGTEFRLGADDPAFAAHLYNPDSCPHYPEGIDFPDGITDTPNGPALQITKDLSDAYTNAFVAFVSSPAFANTAPADLPNYYLAKDVPPTDIIAIAQELLPTLTAITYYPPSVLGFSKKTVGPTASNLWMLVPGSSTTRGGWKEWFGFPAVWHDCKWKFSYWIVE